MHTSKACLTVSFPDVDWSFLQSVYGWGALQYQAWARGTLTLNSRHRQSILLFTDNILEFWLDGKSYFGGDFHSYRRAPLTLRLDPGEHRLDIRLLRDVRVMGSIGNPTIQATIEAQVVPGGLSVVDGGYIFPDIVDGKLPSTLASVPVRNDGSMWIHILGLDSADVRMIDTREAGRSLIMPWRIISLFHSLRMVRSVLRLDKQDPWVFMFLCFILLPSSSPFGLCTPLMICTGNASLPLAA